MLAPNASAQSEDDQYAAQRQHLEELRLARREVRRLLQELRDDVRDAPLFEVQAIKRMLRVYVKEKRTRELEAAYLESIKRQS